MENMERLLGIWIEEQAQHNVLVSLMIQEKVTFLFLDFKSEYDEESTVASFVASKGWFQHFKKLCNFYNIKITYEAASVDSEQPTQFVSYLRNLTEARGYNKQEVFDIGDTRLYWKWMP
jgi:hypothetical protein